MRGFKPLTITADMVVDTNLFDVAPAAYSAGTTYALDAYASVAGTLGEILIYKSLQASNTGHTPASSPTWWVYVSSTYEEHDALTTYNIGHRVYDPLTSTIKESTRSENTNHSLDNTPVWKLVGKADYSLTTPFHVMATTYARDAMVIGWIDSGSDDGVDHNVFGVFKSKQNANTGHDTDQTPPAVTIPPTPPSGNAWWQLIAYAYPKYNFFAVYVLGERVIDEDGNIYESQIDDNSQQLLTNPVQWWLDVGPSNLMAMFDGEITAASKAMQELTVTVASGIVDTVGLMGVYGGVVTCTVRDGLGGTVVYEETKGLSGNIVSDWWDFIYADPEFPRKKAVFENIPPYVDSHVTITVEGDAEVRIGALLMGQQKSLGIGAKYGASVQLVDLSRTEADAFGTIRFIQGRYYERLDLNVMLRKVDFNRVHLELTDMRGQPWFLVVSDDPDLSEALLMYGYYKDYRNVIDYPGMTLYSLQFESLVSE